MSERRELYRSPNGDSWFLGREPENGHVALLRLIGTLVEVPPYA